jgi:hypothetical protein
MGSSFGPLEGAKDVLITSASVVKICEATDRDLPEREFISIHPQILCKSERCERSP